MKKFFSELSRRAHINTRPRDILLQKMYSCIGSVIAYALKDTPVTPNQVTIIGLITGLAASLLFLKQGYSHLIAAAVLVQISVITDYIDGVLARHKGLSSTLGSWLDFAIDRFVDIMIILGISLGVFFKTGDSLILVMGYIAVSARLIINLTQYSFKIILAQADAIIDETQKKSIIKEFLYTRAFIYMVLFIFAVLNQMKLYIIFLACYGTLFWVVMIVYCGYKIRKLIRQGVIR